MLMSAVSRVVSAWFAFLLPCYSTFKVLSRRPISEPDLQKWAMYWAVIGAFVAFEYLAEWLISWLPFYWEIKTAFLLFLSLPQTQGSTYIYNAYLHPFFTRNERDLDAGIVALQSNVLAFIQGKMAALWDIVWSFSTRSRPQSQAQPGQTPGQNPTPLAWLLSTDIVRSALTTIQSNPGAQATYADAMPVRSRHNSNVSSARPSPGISDVNSAPPPFPIPQHFHES